MNASTARSDYIFGTSSVADAVDNAGGRLGAAMSDGTGVDITTANDYLGTFTYTASSASSSIWPALGIRDRRFAFDQEPLSRRARIDLIAR